MEHRRSTQQQNASLTSHPTKPFCWVTHTSKVYTKISKNVDQTCTDKTPAGSRLSVCCGGGRKEWVSEWVGRDVWGWREAADRLSVCLRTHWWLKWPPLFRGPNMHVPLVNSTLQLLHSELSFYFSTARPHKELSPNLFTALYCLQSNGAHTSR